LFQPQIVCFNPQIICFSPNWWFHTKPKVGLWRYSAINPTAPADSTVVAWLWGHTDISRHSWQTFDRKTCRLLVLNEI
jgi:hypothetical protein